MQDDYSMLLFMTLIQGWHDRVVQKEYSPLLNVGAKKTCYALHCCTFGPERNHAWSSFSDRFLVVSKSNPEEPVLESSDSLGLTTGVVGRWESVEPAPAVWVGQWVGQAT